MRRQILALTLGVLGAILGGCGDPTGGPPGGPGGAGERVGWPDRLTLGLIPVEGGAEVTARFGPLIEHLEDALGLPVEPVAASSYNAVIIGMRNGQVDIGYYGPKSYVAAAEQAGAEALVMETSGDGSKGYHAILIVHPESGIDTVEGGEGKVFAFVDPNSTSGYLYPKVLLDRDFGIDPESFFSDVVFTRRHQTSILQVRQGQVDVAATNTLDLDRAIETGAVRTGEVKEIWRSEMIPGAPFAARPDLPETLKAAVRDALLGFDDPEGLARLQSVGYVEVRDEDYDIVRYMNAKQAELDR